MMLFPTEIYFKEHAIFIQKQLSDYFSRLKETLHLTEHSAICKSFDKVPCSYPVLKKYQSLLGCYYIEVLYFSTLKIHCWMLTKIRKWFINVHCKYYSLATQKQFFDYCFFILDIISYCCTDDFSSLRKKYLFVIEY